MVAVFILMVAVPILIDSFGFGSGYNRTENSNLAEYLAG